MTVTALQGNTGPIGSCRQTVVAIQKPFINYNSLCCLVAVPRKWQILISAMKRFQQLFLRGCCVHIYSEKPILVTKSVSDNVNIEHIPQVQFNWDNLYLLLPRIQQKPSLMSVGKSLVLQTSSSLAHIQKTSNGSNNFTMGCMFTIQQIECEDAPNSLCPLEGVHWPSQLRGRTSVEI